MEEKVKVGMNVQYRLASSEYRPMLILKIWDSETVNGVVFLDGLNDDRYQLPITIGSCMSWRTSVTKGDMVGQWRFIE